MNFRRKLFVRLLLFLLLIVLLDFSIGKILRHYYFRTNYGINFKTTEVIEKTHADLLVIGSVKASQGYVTESFEDSLGYTAYNAGRERSFIFYHYGLLQCVLKRYSPKIVILDFTAEEFEKDKASYTNLASLLPYYQEHPEIRPIIDLRGPFEKVKVLSSVYPFNSLVYSIFSGNHKETDVSEKSTRKFIPIEATLKSHVIKDKPVISHQIDNTMVKIYDSFIRDCIKSGTRLFIVCSPYYFRAEIEGKSISIGKQIAGKYHVPFFDYSDDPLFVKKAELFTDSSTLNFKGAEAFSNDLIGRMKTIMKE